MNKKLVLLLFFFCVLIINIFSQEQESKNYFQRNFYNRVFLGYYTSYFDDNIQLLQGGYDAVLKLIHITPNYNLLDFGIGLNGLLVFDMVNEIQKDNFGNERPKNGRMTFGFDLNWNIRLYVLPIQKINSRIFIEGCGMSLVVFAREFPKNGTHVNIGTNVGLGMEYPIFNNHKAYTILKWF
jgi:hypothetical protein